MKITVGRLDRETGTVPVTFELDGLVHTRPVNAVLAEDGTHDREATLARVEDVGRGVAHKFALGVLGTQAPDL